MTNKYERREKIDADKIACHVNKIHKYGEELSFLIKERSEKFFEDLLSLQPEPHPVAQNTQATICKGSGLVDDRSSPDGLDYCPGCAACQPAAPTIAPASVAEAALTVANRVFQFDLRKMIERGDDYNQAVKDAADAVSDALRAISIEKVVNLP